MTVSTVRGHVVAGPHRGVHTVAAATLVAAGAGWAWWLGARFDDVLALPELHGLVVRIAGVIVVLAGGWHAWSARPTSSGWSALSGRSASSGWSALSGRSAWSGRPSVSATRRGRLVAGGVLVFGGLGLASGSLGRILAAALLAVAALDYLAWSRAAPSHSSPRVDLGVLGPNGSGMPDRWPENSKINAAEGGQRSAETLIRRAALRCWLALARPVEWLADATVFARLGPTIWVTYGAFVAIGAAVAVTGVAGRLVTDGWSPGAIVALIAVATVSMPVGARLLWFAVARDNVRAMGLTTALRTVGLVSWGAYLAAFAVVIGFALAHGEDVLWLLDRTVPFLLICSVFGRIGCLTYGCCFGRPWPHGIRWSSRESKIVRQLGPAEAATRRAPVQVMSAASDLIAATAGLLVSLRPAPAGAVTAVALLCYALGRFGVDTSRDNVFRLRSLPRWNLGQVISLIFAAVALALLTWIDGEPSWPRSALDIDWSALAALTPLVAGAALVTLVVTGLHWRQVGRQ